MTARNFGLYYNSWPLHLSIKTPLRTSWMKLWLKELPMEYLQGAPYTSTLTGKKERRNAPPGTVLLASESEILDDVPMEKRKERKKKKNRIMSVRELLWRATNRWRSYQPDIVQSRIPNENQNFPPRKEAQCIHHRTSECAYFNMSLDLPTYRLLYSKWDYTFNSYEPRAKEWIIISNEGYLEVSYDLSNLPSHHIQSFSHLASELLAREFDISIRDFNYKIQRDRKAAILSTTFFVANCDLLVIPDDRDFMLKRPKTKRFSTSLSRTLVFNPGAHFIKWVLKEKKRKSQSQVGQVW